MLNAAQESIGRYLRIEFEVSHLTFAALQTLSGHRPSIMEQYQCRAEPTNPIFRIQLLSNHFVKRQTV